MQPVDHCLKTPVLTQASQEAKGKKCAVLQRAMIQTFNLSLAHCER